MGQHLNYVLNHLALADIPLELAQRIAAGELPMSVATAVADLPEPKRTGLSIFILANEPGKLTAKAIKECATTMKKWPGLQMPLMVKEANRHGSDRNVFEFLTGRPMGANESYGDWFSQQLDAQGGDLSDPQLFTLLSCSLPQCAYYRRNLPGEYPLSRLFSPDDSAGIAVVSGR